MIDPIDNLVRPEDLAAIETTAALAGLNIRTMIAALLVSHA
jgi:hypothetical protein